MPFERPTLAELIAQAQADTEARLPGSDARTRRSNLNVLARVLAGTTHGLYGYLDFLARQVFPDTADAEHLDRWAAIWEKPRKAPSFAAGTLDFVGQAGAVIPAGSVLAAGEIEYETDADVTFSGAIASGAVTALTPGLASNLGTGLTVVFVSPVSGVAASATVAVGGLAGGADAESDAALRARLLARIRQPPQGGAAHDYEDWALEVPDITRAWVYPDELGPNTVTIRVVSDAAPGGLIPAAPKIAEVQAWIDARRPVSANPTVVAPVAVPLDLSIQLIPSTQAIRDAVTAEIADLIRRQAVPGGTILLSHLREAVSLAAGETDHVLVLPVANVAHATGQIAVPGTITWS